MGENSKIEWCHHTFNPVIGCAKVSAGCKHCYAEAMMDKHWGKAKWGPTARRVRTSAATWRKPLQWNATAKAEGRRYRVFCASLADVFEDHADWEQPRRDLLQMIVATPHLDWLLLTKRPENVCGLIEQATGFSDAEMWFHGLGNVWIGASVEDQAAVVRVSELLKIPAPVRFLSMEPLIESVKLWEYDEFNGRLDGAGIIHDYRWQPGTVNGPGESVGCSYPGISWVIAGGESGHHARPMNPDWVRSLRDQCIMGGVPFFFKQWGTAAKKQKFGHGVDVQGRLLDGREWSEFPQTEVAYAGD